MTIDTLLKRIQQKKAKVGIIGLGYVGLPLAVLFAKKGFSVTGFVRNANKIKLLEMGKSHLGDPEVENDLRLVTKTKKLKIKLINDIDLSVQDILIICVPTPVTHNKQPDLSDLKVIARQLSQIDISNKLIINESTVAPFMTEDVFRKLKGDYFLACSPERVDPGNKTRTTENIPKVVGGKNKESLLLAVSLYEQVLSQEIVEVESMQTAEMTKMLENTYRAVNIALINEFANLSEACGIDILQVVHAAKSKWSFHAHYPGIGVGGHCIPVDPYYILELAKKKKVKMNLVKNGLLVNESMPSIVGKKVIKNYRKGMNILLYGITYKKDVNDMRESPVVILGQYLQTKKIKFKVYDPLISEKIIEEMGFTPGKLEKADMIIVGTDHKNLLQDFPKVIGDETIVVDGRNSFQKKVGKKVFGVGRTLV